MSSKPHIQFDGAVISPNLDQMPQSAGVQTEAGAQQWVSGNSSSHGRYIPGLGLTIAQSVGEDPVSMLQRSPLLIR